MNYSENDLMYVKLKWKSINVGEDEINVWYIC